MHTVEFFAEYVYQTYCFQTNLTNFFKSFIMREHPICENIRKLSIFSHTHKILYTIQLVSLSQTLFNYIQDL